MKIELTKKEYELLKDCLGTSLTVIREVINVNVWEYHNAPRRVRPKKSYINKLEKKYSNVDNLIKKIKGYGE